jgi:DNA-binding NarL/FixJ family response regulator
MTIALVSLNRLLTAALTSYLHSHTVVPFRQTGVAEIEPALLSSPQRPAAVVIDSESLGAATAYTIARQCRKNGFPVVMLLVQGGASDLRLGLAAGVRVYVEATEDVQLEAAIRSALTGAALLPHALQDAALGTLVEERNVLTIREREVLVLLAEGRSVKDLATVFGLSAKTIEAHKFNLMRKLGLHNRTELVHYAIREGLIRVDTKDTVAA